MIQRDDLPYQEKNQYWTLYCLKGSPLHRVKLGLGLVIFLLLGSDQVGLATSGFIKFLLKIPNLQFFSLRFKDESASYLLQVNMITSAGLWSGRDEQKKTIKKRISIELFINRKQELYTHKGWIKEVDRISEREVMQIGSNVKIGGNENQQGQPVWIELL